MKLAATRALAALAKEDVPDSVLRAYGVDRHGIRPRVHHPQAVRSRACSSGKLPPWRRPPWRPAWRSSRSISMQYREELERRLGKAHEVMRGMIHKAQTRPQARRLHRRRRGQDPARLPDPAGREDRASHPAGQRGSASAPRPPNCALHLDGVQIVDPRRFPRLGEYAEEFYSLRQRKGVTPHGSRADWCSTTPLSAA